MKKWLFLIIVLLFCFNLNVKAENTCTSSEMARLKNLAEKVDLTYDYGWKFYEKGKDGHEYYYEDFTIIAANLNKELKVLIEEDYLTGKYREFKNDGTGSGKINGFINGTKVTITIRAYTANECSGKILLTKTLQLPYFNSSYSTYYMSCENYPDFKYCKQFLDEKITDKMFLEELDKYIIENKGTNSLDNNIANSNNSSLIANVKIIAVIIAAILLLVVLVTIIKKKQKNKL